MVLVGGSRIVGGVIGERMDMDGLLKGIHVGYVIWPFLLRFDFNRILIVLDMH